MAITFLSILLLIISLYTSFTTANDVFSYSGCYLSSSLQSMGLSSKGSYTWQSPSYCENQCSGSVFIALTEGGNCYCGSGVDVLSVSKQAESNCDTKCYGWPADMCGDGDGDYMNVYVNRNKANTKSSSSISMSSYLTSSSTAFSPSSSSSSSAGSTTSLAGSSNSYSSSNILKATFASSSTLSQSSISSDPTSSTRSSTDNQSSDISSFTTTTPTISSSFSSVTSSTSSTSKSVSSIQLTTKIIVESIITKSNEAQHTVVMTEVSVIETVAPTGSTNSYYNGTMNFKNKSSSKPLSGGAIAGIVVGCVVGIIVIVVLIVFYFSYMRYHSRTLDIEESKQYQPYSFGEKDANTIFIPESTGYLNHGSIRSKFSINKHNNNNSRSSWKLPSRSSTRNNNHSNLNESNNANSNVFNMRNGSVHSSVATTNRPVSIVKETINGNTNNRSTFTSPSALKARIMRRSQLPCTVFEESSNVSFYDGVQRLSTSSLPDMMEERKPLRIVNPDDSSVKVYDNDISNDEDSNSSTTESDDFTSLSTDNEKC